MTRIRTRVFLALALAAAVSLAVFASPYASSSPDGLEKVAGTKGFLADGRVHTIWRVYSLGSDRGPNNLSGTYVGEQGTAAAGSQAGGNWIYGGPNAEVGMLASGVIQDAGYNLAAGIAAMTIRLKQ